jgi:hypoxanthine phosphoribosyltransferase
MAEPPVRGARLVVPPAAVEGAWNRLAQALQPVVAGGDCVLLGVLVGGMVPLVHVAARLRGDFALDYCHVSRYLGGTAGGALHWFARPRQRLAGRTVILIDDIFDEGHTLAELRHFCLGQGAARVLVAVLARKRHARAVVGPAPEFVGLDVPDEYVFGCGMDYRDRWRHLDAIYAIDAPATERPGHAP